MWQLPFHWAGPGVKDCPLSAPLPSPHPSGTLLASSTSKNQWAQLQGVDWDLSQAASALLGLPHPHGHLSVGTHGDSAALPSMGAGGGRCGGDMQPPLQRACKKQQLPCPVQEAKLWPKYAVVQGKKIPMQYKEINTDINTNNPISFVLTAW